MQQSHNSKTAPLTLRSPSDHPPLTSFARAIYTISCIQDSVHDFFESGVVVGTGTQSTLHADVLEALEPEHLCTSTAVPHLAAS